jgi:hypothetical protein
MNIEVIAVRISKAIQEYLREENKLETTPKDVMEYLIQKGIFEKDHKNGLPLRNVLRELDKMDKLDLIEGIRHERKAINTYWYFDIA